jgi:hypothetical protein
MNELGIVISLGGWLFAIIQFVLTYREGRFRSDEKLLEQTLGYFERGTQARSIGISLVESIWLVRKKNLDVIVPILVSQLVYLLTDAENYGQESRNLYRILSLLEKCLPHLQNSESELCEIWNALLVAATSPGKIEVTQGALRIWYKKFGGDLESFEAETKVSDVPIQYEQLTDIKKNGLKPPSLLGEKGRG